MEEKCHYTYLSFEETRLCACANISAALPLPSAMTTGTAGQLVTDSNTVRIVLGPPSRTSSTTGIPCDLPKKKKKKKQGRVVLSDPNLSKD